MLMADKAEPSAFAMPPLIIPPPYLILKSLELHHPNTQPRNPTKRYYLGGAIICGDEEGGAHHRK